MKSDAEINSNSNSSDNISISQRNGFESNVNADIDEFLGKKKVRKESRLNRGSCDRVLTSFVHGVYK